MTTISVKLPLRPSRRYGYSMNSEYNQVVRQNLKHLLLTSPGERMMLPDFGVGLSRTLFEPNSASVRAALITRIHKQVDKYMPFLTIENIEQNVNGNTLNLKIYYFIESLGLDDSFELDLN